MDKIQKVGGALLIITGLIMALGGRDNIVAYFNKAKDEPQIQEQNIAQEEGKDSDRGKNK